MVVPTYKDYWDIPGGYVETGESPLQAASREVREEIGITSAVSWPSTGRRALSRATRCCTRSTAASLPRRP
ncbi:NUDIX domain-containing protein [Streptomyces massasporeus]|uniref:NUDIX domain-containing protein n=1 Tax=Streptomyces massasporeus TaxID=67324 RepID=UPI003F4CDBC6